jgi:thiamine kinase
VVQELSPARARELIPPAALAQVPGYEATARIAVLAGGEVNRTFRVATREGRFILRLHAASGLALGADHAREARLQNAAAAAGIAPAVLHIDPARRFMVSEYVAGRVWSAADFSDVASLRKLAVTLERLHAVAPPIPAPFDLAALLNAFAERIGQAAPSERPQLAKWLQRAHKSVRECASDTRVPALFHSDLQHGNLIATGKRLMLIDWEYAAVGDPLYDLACVLAYYPQAQRHARELLDASGLADRATLRMLEHATWLYVLLSFFWERIRQIGAAASGAGIRLPTPAD